MDCKYVAIKLPLDSGSLYFNYKGYFNIILMAIFDALYVFMHTHIGSYGSNNDSSVSISKIKGIYQRVIAWREVQ